MKTSAPTMPAVPSKGEPASSTLVLRSPHDAHQIPALHLTPVSRSRGTVILLQEIFGIDGFIRNQARHWVAAGYAVMAPALFARIDRGFEAAHDARGVARGMSAISATPDAQAIADIHAFVDAATPSGPVHLVGFCYGGRLAWAAAARLAGIRSAIVFYGRVAAPVDQRPRCPVQLHFGMLDKHLPVADMAGQVCEHYPQAVLHLYPDSGHGFVNRHSPDWHARDAAQALRRAGSFLDASS